MNELLLRISGRHASSLHVMPLGSSAAPAYATLSHLLSDMDPGRAMKQERKQSNAACFQTTTRGKRAKKITFQFIKFDEPKWLGVMMIIP
jgi:hypothetical protein